MMKKRVLGLGLMIGFSFAIVGCGSGGNPSEEGIVCQPNDTRPDCQDGGKADRINWANNPNRFGFTVEPNAKTLFEKYPAGTTDNIPWPDTYWPTTEDAVNARWQGSDVLSPVEKYDAAFNNWKPTEEFMKLRPFCGCSGEFDAAYYEQLGPAAKYWSDNHGNKPQRDLWKSQADREASCASEAQSCTATSCSICSDQKTHCQYTDYNEAEYCNSNYQSCLSELTYVASTCESLQVETCDDTIEGWFGLCHAWVPAAILEKEPGGPVTYNGITFEVSDIKALLIMMYNSSDAVMLGKRCNTRSNDVKRDANGRITDDVCRDSNPGSLHIVLTNLIGRDKKAFAEDKTADYQVWNQPVRGYQINSQEEISELEAAKLLDPKATSYAKYDAEAKKFFKVQTEVYYVTESSPGKSPLTPNIEYYTQTDTYDYILECDDQYRIIGGEYLDDSVDSHPDFLWLPKGAGPSSNPYANLDDIRMLRDKSLTP